MAHKEQSSSSIGEAYDVLARFVVFGARGQPPEWPFSIVETNWYHARFFPREVYPVLCDLEAEGLSLREVSKLCWGPSAITHWLYITEPALGFPGERPFEGLSATEAQDFIRRTLCLIALQRTGDPLCRDKRNLVISDTEAKSMLDRSFLFGTSKQPKLARLVSILNLTLWHYCILIQIGHRAYSQEFHGPYVLDPHKQMVIRDFFNLRADAVWPFSAGMPESVRVVEIYEGGKIEFDMFNHFAISRDAKLVQVAFQINGHDVVDMAEVKTLYARCEWLLGKANEHIASFRKRDWVQKVVQMRYHWLQPHASMLRRDLYPGSEVLGLEDRVSEAENASVSFGRTLGQAISGLSGEALIRKAAGLFVDCLSRE
jgi:hypothetical protein